MLLLSACEPQKEATIVAQVNDEVLTLTQCKARFSTEQWNNMAKSQKQEFVEKWIEMTLMAQAADASGLSAQPQIKAKIADSAMKIKANALIAQRLSQITITEDELFSYYRVHKNDYQKKIKEYRLQRIFLSSGKKLDEVRNAIESTSFDRAARKYSEESYASKGGFVGWIAKGQTDPLIWNALKSLKRYRYKTVETATGLYVVRFYNERYVMVEKNFNEVKKDIREIVLKKKREEMYQQTIKDLLSAADVSISL